MEESKDAWQVTSQMIAANCSTIRNILCIKDYIYYAITNTILVYDYKQHKVINCLNGHLGRINGVALLDTNDGTTAICSVDSEKTMIVWKSTNVAGFEWTKQVYKDAHGAEINNVFATRHKDTIYITTFCLDGNLKVWKSTDIDLNENFTLAAQLFFGKNLQEAFKMFPINDRYIMMLIGGFDKLVHVYTIDTQGTNEEEIIEYHISLTGHSNSIRDFCVTDAYENDLRYIFSSSQDCLIRVWKICKISDAEAEEELKKQEEAEYALEHLKTKTSYILRFGDNTVYNITLSSVLQHHSHAVNSVRLFEDKTSTEADPLHRLTLLSSSLDFTVCLWKVDPSSGIWTVETTLGEMKGNKHSFFGAEFLSENQIFAYTYNGAFHRWDYENGVWFTKPCVTGHFDEVPDLDWDPYRDYLVTTSKDQTTRVYTNCRKMERWCEISRPQVHGYDINCIAFLKSINTQNGDTDYKYGAHIVSGADEKILRIFDPPYSFVKAANKYNEDKLRFTKDMSNEDVEQKIIGKQTEVASMTLGLMNKPIMPKKNQRVDEEQEGGTTVDDFEPDVLTNKEVKQEIVEDNSTDVMLIEEYLMSRTRWPERNKLYGHAYEIYCVATTKKGDYIVTAAKSKKTKYSNIFVWAIDSLNPICQLPAHDYTVHQMEFSPDDQYLLSVSRDRQFSVFQRNDDPKEPFKLVQLQKQAHKRVLWSCSWAHNSRYFATGSREKTYSLKFWDYCKDSNSWVEHSSVAKNIHNVTALAFFPSAILHSTSLGIVVGQDTGELTIWIKPFNHEIKEWTKVYSFPEHFNHSLTVRRIKFKETEQSDENTYHIATCSNDATTRIFKIAQDGL